MLSRKLRSKRYLPTAKAVPAGLRRRRRGAVLPVVVFSLMMTIAFLAFTIDVMRTVHTVSVIDFASQATALRAYSFAAGANGNFSEASIRDAVQQTGGADGAPWHLAPAGPRAGESRTPVIFDDGNDVSVYANPTDRNELFLKVTARRQGLDSLKLMFYPAIFAFNAWSGSPVPANTTTASPYKATEVIGQPASRIGAGAPWNASGGSRAAQLAGYAAFPLALSNTQFSIASQPSQSLLTYTADLVASNQPAYTAPAPPGHIKACLVNVAHTGSNLNYYGDAQGNLAIDQLNATLQYFNSSLSTPSLTPGVVERGSLLKAFDPADQTFQQRKSQVAAYLNGLVGRHCILPVVQKSGDRFFDGANTVVGFAKMRLRAVVSNSSGLSATFDILDSVPVPNASFANGVACVPEVSGALLPPPVAPFQARVLQGEGLSVRPRGVVMAPSLSPRNVNPASTSVVN